MKDIEKALKRAGIEINDKIREELDKLEYGLYFKRYNEEAETNDYNIIEDKSRELKGAGPDNVLYEGDNLYLLREMKRRGEKVDIIYIDPPYNVKANVLYDDDYGGHAEWLSFMEKRLILARDIMNEDALIFISIDDGEQAQLKLLMDSVFGEKNLLGVNPRKTHSIVNNSKTGYSKEHDYVLIYTKDINKAQIRGELKDFSLYKNPDEDPNGRWKSGDPTVPAGNQRFPVKNPKSGGVSIPPAGRGWIFKEEELKGLIDKGRVVFKESSKKGEREFIYKRYLNEIRDQNLPFSSLELLDNDFLNQAGTKELIEVFGDSVFEYPKPNELLKKIISSHPNKDAVILDFFAGSGTTAQAVMELNEEDNGNRRFILCNVNEVSNQKVFDRYNKEAGADIIINKNGSVRKTKANLLKYEEALKDPLYSRIYKSKEIQDDGICRRITYERTKRVNKNGNHNINMKYYVIGGVNNEEN